jgi:hypothetical protein
MSTFCRYVILRALLSFAADTLTLLPDCFPAFRPILLENSAT